MSLKHSAFLFDYLNFQSTVTPLVLALTSGNAIPLQEKVAQVRQRVRLNINWILYDKGAYITDDIDLNQSPRYQNALWGNWLLVVLSSFLQPAISFDYDWLKLSTALRAFNWNDEDVERVISGLPSVWLLKPEANYQRNMATEWTLPYW
jgi:hypothetical protein